MEISSQLLDGASDDYACCGTPDYPGRPSKQPDSGADRSARNLASTLDQFDGMAGLFVFRAAHCKPWRELGF